MAGTYADVPGYKFSYDVDGTACIRINADTSTTTMTTAQLRSVNEESTTGSLPDGGSPTIWAFVFPELRDIVGIFLASPQVFGLYGCDYFAYYSTDTTNGVNGTWTAFTIPVVATIYSNYNTMIPSYRNNIFTVALLGVKGIRIRAQEHSQPSAMTPISAIHFYGGIHIGETRKLALWHPTLDAEVTAAYFDFGDASQGTTATKQFRVKNLGSLTASSIDLATDVLYEQSPLIANQHQLSKNDASYATVLRMRNSGDTADLTLATNEISPIVYLKRATNPSAAIGLYSGRVRVFASFA
jgi:hypothetical protein